MEFINNKSRKEQAQELEVLKKTLIKKGVISENELKQERDNLKRK